MWNIEFLDWFDLCYVQMTRKKINLIFKLLLGSRIIKNKSDMPADISKRGYFGKRFLSSWSHFKFNGYFFDFFWSFRYWTTQTSQKIWNLTPFEPGSWVSQVLSHPIFLLLISAGMSDLFLMILDPSKSLKIKLIFSLVIGTQDKSNQSRNLIFYTVWAREVGVTCLNFINYP